MTYHGEIFSNGTVGIAWCREEDYDALRAVIEHPNDLPATWRAFTQDAKFAEQFYKSQGKVVRRVYIDAPKLVAWCNSKGCRVDAKAHMRFAQEVAADPNGGAWARIEEIAD